MKAAVISSQGSPVAPNVKLVNNWPVPKLVAGELLVRTEACALNQLDLWVGRGVPGLQLTYPRISGSDGVGIVEAVGQETDSAWIGKRVALNAAIPQDDAPAPDRAQAPPDRLMIGEHLHGTLAEKFIAPTANVLDIGDADPVEAAAFGLVHLTAWRMMWTRARIAPGQWALITGIGGGVALAALGIAKHIGCRTIVTSRHQRKLDLAIKLGADHAVLDKGEDFSREVRRITDKRGVDVCVDSIGKAVHLSCIKSLARGGVFVTCGNTSGPDAVTDLSRVFWNELSILGSTMGDMNEFREVMSLFRSGALKPVVDQVLPAAEASKAFARLESAQQFGKVVVKWS